MTDRRQRQQFIFAALVVVVALVNILFFFILNRPARTEYTRLQESIKNLESEVDSSRSFYENLQTTTDQLDRFDKDKRALLVKHLISRDTGYSQIVSTLDALVKQSGLQKTRVGYSPDPDVRAGLTPISITIPLEGSYRSVTNFIKGLESSDTLFLINSIGLSTSEDGGDRSTEFDAPQTSGNVSLSLGLETYFYQ